MYIFSYLTTTALLAAAGASAQNSTIKCASGLKMFVSRGTGEITPLGVTETLVQAIKEQIGGSDYEAINYPASLIDPVYFTSVGNGTMLVKKAAMEYAQACPSSKMAFFGYSQGAQITSNSFCGMPTIWSVFAGIPTTGTDVTPFLKFAEPLPTEVTKNVVAVVLFGDPTHRNEASYKRSNSTGDGVFYRDNISTCEALGNRIRSYCEAGDPYCDVGGAQAIATVHLTYIINYGAEIAKYVIEQYKTGGSGGNSSESTPPPTIESTPASGAAGLLSTPVSIIAATLLVLGMI